ncbi:MAG TPA: HEXXH motif-containing putative peptide modification protein [Chthoniobacterales bacterium]
MPLARALDQRMRDGLAASLQYLAEAGGAALLPDPAPFAAVIGAIKSGLVSPLAFCLYSEIVQAVEAGRLSAARESLQELMALPKPGARTEIIDLADPGADLKSRLYQRYVDTDPANRFPLFRPSSEKSAASRRLIEDAFVLMRDTDPDLHAEIQALLREIVLAAGPEDGSGLTFDGASSFMMWGAIVINADRSDSVLEMVQMLAHESAHNVLFGLFSEDPALFNGYSERQASPLRRDPRPLEGIYHAAFVTARMYRAVHHVARSAGASSPLREEAGQALEELRGLFRQGYETVIAHGRFSPLGREVIEEASRYLEAHR